MSFSGTGLIIPDQRDHDHGYCAAHPSKPVTSYCGHHRLSMCIMCLLSDHKDCIAHVKPINSDVNVETDTSWSHTSANETERICERLTTNVNDVKNRKTAWIENLGKVERELVQGLRHIRYKIVQKIDILTTEAMDMSKSLLKEHKMMYEHDVETLTDFQCRLREIKRRLSHMKDPNDLLSIQRQLDQIKDEFQSRGMKSGDVKVHFHVSEIVGKIDNDMATLGELCVEDVTDRVRSLYLSPSEIQRFSAEMLGELPTHETATSTNMESNLFVRLDEVGSKSDYLRLSPSPDTQSKLLTTVDGNPPPLPTMESRLLSPPSLIASQTATLTKPPIDSSSSGVDSQHLTNEQSLITISHRKHSISKETHLLAEVTENVVENNTNAKQNDGNIRKGSVAPTGAMFFEPDEGDRIDEVAFTNPEFSPIILKSDEPCLKIPSLPKKRDTFKQNTSLCFQSTELVSESSHQSTTYKQRYDSSASVGTPTTTDESRISSSRLSSDGYHSAGSGRDSGIVVNPETKHDPESSMLKRPTTPPPCGAQSANPPPCLQVVENTMESAYTRIPDDAEMDRASGSDTSIHARRDAPYSGTKEIHLDKADIRGTVRSTGGTGIPDSRYGPGQRRRNTEKKRWVKSTGTPPTRDTLGIHMSIILERGSERKSHPHKTRNAPFITSMTVLDGGDILVCDYNNNAIELYDSNGSFKDVVCLQKPFGCCRIAENRLSVTSQDPPKLTTLVVEHSIMEQVQERVIHNTTDIFGISFSYGFYCLSCLTEVKLLRDQPTAQEIQIRPLDRRGKSRSSWFNKGRPQKPFFSGVHFALMEKLDDRFYVFTSDAKKRRVASVGVNGMVIWIQTKLDAKTLAYYSQHVLVAAESHVILLHASSGDQIRVISAGIPRQCWSLAVDKEGCHECPSLLVAGCDKTSARHIARVSLEQAVGDRLTEVYV